MNYSIILQNVTKRYYLEKPRTLKKWFKAIFSPYGRLTVIENFSLKVHKGEFILITGPNGCGKTTLLKLIAGITIPDEGNIATFGRIVPLIELGAGFNYELTGRENITVNATILGVEKKKINNISQEIIDFSGLNDFIDAPLKRYSSGMITRLAFSIAAFAKPEILLLDEIFALGDEVFQKKSLEKINEFRQKRVTILLVSHYYKYFEDIVDRRIDLHSLADSRHWFDNKK